MIGLKKILQEIPINVKNNVFGSLLEVNALFDLCLVVDGYIKSKYANPTRAARASFGPHLMFLSDSGSHGLVNLLPFRNLGNVNTSFTSNFDNTLTDFLTSSFQISPARTLLPIDEDFAITYGLRNFGGHRIENQPVIYNNFEELSQRILNALFYLVENCT